MKKIFIAGMLTLFSSNLFGSYELFTTYTKPLSSINVVKKTVLFSGTFKNYQSQFESMNKKYSKSSTAAVAGTYGAAVGISSLGASAAGLGVGIAFAVLTPVLLDMKADQLFIRVEKLEDSKGNITLKRVLMVGDKNPSYSLEQANSFMKRGN